MKFNLTQTSSPEKKAAHASKAVQNLLEDIKWGGTPEMLLQKYPWAELTLTLREELLSCARTLPDSHQVYTLLVYLYRVSRDEDLWYSIEVLNHSIQYLAMKADDRQAILRTIRGRLDRLKDDVGPAMPFETLRRYWLLEATYYALNGATLAEGGHKAEAVQNYQIALGIFSQLGLAKEVTRYKELIQTFNEINAITPQATAPTPQPPFIQPDRPTVPPSVPVDASQPAPAAPAPIPSLPPAETFLPLPDVWFEEGRLRMPGPDMIDSPESRRLNEQIHQQSEILAGIQLEIQMYLERRSILAQEVQTLEKKLKTLKDKESKAGKTK